LDATPKVPLFWQRSIGAWFCAIQLAKAGYDLAIKHPVHA